MIVGVIYLITCLINGKKYVGQTTQLVEKRFKQHANNKDSHLGRAIRKYGRKNFKVEVLEECYTVEQLNAREIFWIAALNTKVPNGYNITDGGDGTHGHKHDYEFYVERSVARRNDSPYTNLIAEIDAHKLTYAVLAKILGLSQSAVAYKMCGKLNFTDKDKVTLARFFNKPIEYLFECGNVVKLKTKREADADKAIARRGNSPYPNLIIEIDAHQLSYNRLAPLLGLSLRSVSRKMRGEQNFTAKEKGKLAEILGKTIEYLFECENSFHVKTKNEISAKKSVAHRGYSPYPNLIAEIDAHQLSYSRLAPLLGLSVSNVCRKMRGELNFTAKDKVALEKIFGKTAEYLLQRDDG